MIRAGQQHSSAWQSYWFTSNEANRSLQSAEYSYCHIELNLVFNSYSKLIISVCLESISVLEVAKILQGMNDETWRQASICIILGIFNIIVSKFHPSLHHASFHQHCNIKAHCFSPLVSIKIKRKSLSFTSPNAKKVFYIIIIWISRNLDPGRASMLPELFSFDPDVKGKSKNNKNLHPIIRGNFIEKYFPQNSISICMKAFVNVSKQFINIFIIENIIPTLQIRIWNKIILSETVHTFWTKSARHGPVKINTEQQ